MNKIKMLLAAILFGATMGNQIYANTQELPSNDTINNNKKNRTTALTVSGGGAFLQPDSKLNSSNYGFTSGVTMGASLEQEVLTDGLFLNTGFTLGKIEFDNLYANTRTNTWWNTISGGVAWSPLSLTKNYKELPIDVTVGADANLFMYESQALDLTTGKRLAEQTNRNNPFDRKAKLIYSGNASITLPAGPDWSVGAEFVKYFVSDEMLDTRKSKENDNFYTLTFNVTKNLKGKNNSGSWIRNPSVKVGGGMPVPWTDHGNKVLPDDGFGTAGEVEVGSEIIDGVRFNVAAYASSFNGENKDKGIEYNSWVSGMNATISVDPIVVLNPEAKNSFSLTFGPGIQAFESIYRVNGVRIDQDGTDRSGPLGRQPEAVFYAGLEGNFLMWQSPKTGAKLTYNPSAYVFINGEHVDNRDAANLGERQDILAGINPVAVRYTIKNERTPKKGNAPEAEKPKTEYELLVSQQASTTDSTDRVSSFYMVSNPWVSSDTSSTSGTQEDLEQRTITRSGRTMTTPPTPTDYTSQTTSTKVAREEAKALSKSKKPSRAKGLEHQFTLDNYNLDTVIVESGDGMERIVKNHYKITDPTVIFAATNIVSEINAVIGDRKHFRIDNKYVKDGKVMYGENVDGEGTDVLFVNDTIYLPSWQTIDSLINLNKESSSNQSIMPVANDLINIYSAKGFNSAKAAAKIFGVNIYDALNAAADNGILAQATRRSLLFSSNLDEKADTMLNLYKTHTNEQAIDLFRERYNRSITENELYFLVDYASEGPINERKTQNRLTQNI